MCTITTIAYQMERGGRLYYCHPCMYSIHSGGWRIKGIWYRAWWIDSRVNGWNLKSIRRARESNQNDCIFNTIQWSINNKSLADWVITWPFNNIINFRICMFIWRRSFFQFCSVDCVYTIKLISVFLSPLDWLTLSLIRYAIELMNY